MGGEMRGKLVERLLDELVISDRGLARAKPLEPGRTLAVVGEQAMDVGADDAAVGATWRLR